MVILFNINLNIWVIYLLQGKFPWGKTLYWKKSYNHEICFFHFILKLEVHSEAIAAEASKDRKLREQSEHYSKQLENELEGLKVSFDFPFMKLNQFFLFVLNRTISFVLLLV